MFGQMISIIIPTYNRKELLQEAVASCLAQSYLKIEVLVIDDGSTDGTEKVVRELLRGPWAGKVSYHRKANGGTSSAKNLGLQLARGAYIQYLDSDDLLRPEKLERQMAAIQATNGVIDCCSCFGRIGTKAAGWDGARRIGEMCEDHLSYIKRQCERSVHVMSTMAPLWRKLFVTGVSAWREDLTVAEEWEYYIRLLALRPQVAFVEEDLFWARAHEGNNSARTSEVCATRSRSTMPYAPCKNCSSQRHSGRARCGPGCCSGRAQCISTCFAVVIMRQSAISSIGFSNWLGPSRAGQQPEPCIFAGPSGGFCF